jgi:pimeloyl-ACP methyl ester carboxylesterase
MGSVTEGRFSSGLPYLRLGAGPPLLVSPGLSSEHANPTGWWRRMALSWAGPFADHFTVYLTQRKPGLAYGSTMTDIAADYAAAIEHDIGEPVLLHGTSTGGSVALQLAVDRPELVRRLVLAAAACRLGPAGRDLQSQVASLISAATSEQRGDRPRGAGAAPLEIPRPWTRLGRGRRLRGGRPLRHAGHDRG